MSMAVPPLRWHDTRMMSGRALLLFDGDCGFCRAWIARWQAVTGDRVEYLPYQSPEAEARAAGVPRERLARAVHLVTPGGAVCSGADAVFRALATRRSYASWHWLYRRLPPFRAASEVAYRFVADHRPAFTRITKALWGDSVAPCRYQLAREIFLRGLALTYLAAFGALVPQIEGLLGSRGILPAEELLAAASTRLDAGEKIHLLPTLFWIDASDVALRGVCMAGVVLSLVLLAGVRLAGVARVAALAALWALYLSLVTVGGDFLSFQWDALLLEAGFLAILLAAGGGSGAHWLLRWLVFRLMFGSGIVKLMSGDPTWRHLTALQWHYETQPIPNPVAWYAHQLPASFHRASCAVMFAIELAAPLLIILAPRRPRRLAIACLLGLQALIALTGNYAFFNLLAVALCLGMVDDEVWTALWSRVRRRGGAAARASLVALPAAPRARPAPAGLALRAAMLLLFALTLVEWSARFVEWRRIPAPLRAAASWTAPCRLANNYGLFAVMTTARPEIRIEGSEDGVTWKTYEFRWKAGDARRRPPWVAPYQPRLDWQLWFAALGGPRRTPWFPRFVARLREGSPPVLALLARDPFAGARPRWVRAKLDDYRFTDIATRRREGTWWSVRELGDYGPVAGAPAEPSR